MFTDKNGMELKIGDYIAPDEGLELLITEEKYMEDFGGDCLIATQVIHPDVYSILPQDNLSSQWRKIDEPTNIQTMGIENSSIESIDELENSGVIFDSYDPEPLVENYEAEEEWREREKIYVGE